VGMVVFGGIGSVVGPIVGALWIIGLPAFFPDNELVPFFTSSIGLLMIVMYFPGGFAQIGYAVRKLLFDWAARRLPASDEATSATPVASLASRPVAAADPGPNPVVLLTQDVAVSFGGNKALADASLRVERGEIVGLIGTNGAGKSTFMNAIGGYVRSRGSVQLLGTDISAMSVPQRARLGLGRTFQAAMLFPELTVRETIQVALEARGRTPFVATALGLPRSRVLERTRRAEADQLVDFFGLGRYADEFVVDLSTGTRRVVELACLLALDAKVLCLDEPTAGLAQRETEAFGPLLLAIRRELGASMIVIEHDMPLIMSMSDHVYCLEAGVVIAHGDPASVRSDPNVIASYLGTDERAIARSNAPIPANP
jgi:ABC-type branched-subunit amino acid transport system ATPase component